jgi:hypothetical protein
MIAGMLWMLLISVLLFWFPGGAFVAGLVGGKKAGDVGAAILAVFFPGIVLCLLLFFFSSLLTGMPLIGALAASGGFFWYSSNIGLLLLGAILGGLLR